MNDLVPKQTLSNLIYEANELAQALIESEGQITEELEKLLLKNEQNLAQKVDSYAYCLTRLETENKYWKAEADRLNKVADSFKMAKERLKERLKAYLLETPNHQIQGQLNTFKLAKSKPSLKVNIDQVPDEYKILVSTVEIDKDKIRESLTLGQNVPGAELIESYSLKSSVNRNSNLLK